MRQIKQFLENSESGKLRLSLNPFQRSHAATMLQDFVLVQSVGIFGDRISSWLILTTFVVVLIQCRYIDEDTMSDGFTVTPIVLTLTVAFTLKLAYLWSIVRPGITSIKCWLYVIPAVIILYLTNVVLMTVANVQDDQFEEAQESGQESGGLILGSEADVAAIVQIVSVLSCAYHWVQWLFMASSLGTMWVYLKNDYKGHTSTEVPSQPAA